MVGSCEMVMSFDETPVSGNYVKYFCGLFLVFKKIAFLRAWG